MNRVTDLLPSLRSALWPRLPQYPIRLGRRYPSTLFSASQKDRLGPDPRPSHSKALGGKNIQIRVFLIPRLEVLSPEKLSGVVIHCGTVGTVKPRLEPVYREQAITSSVSKPLFVRRQCGNNGCAAQQRVGCVRHQVGIRRNILHIIGNHGIHADEISAQFRLLSLTSIRGFGSRPFASNSALASVLMTIKSTSSVARSVSSIHRKSGFPENERKFLPETRSLCALSGINAIVSTFMAGLDERGLASC